MTTKNPTPAIAIGQIYRDRDKRALSGNRHVIIEALIEKNGLPAARCRSFSITNRAVNRAPAVTISSTNLRRRFILVEDTITALGTNDSVTKWLYEAQQHANNLGVVGGGALWSPDDPYELVVAATEAIAKSEDPKAFIERMFEEDLARAENDAQEQTESLGYMQGRGAS